MCGFRSACRYFKWIVPSVIFVIPLTVLIFDPREPKLYIILTLFSFLALSAFAWLDTLHQGKANRYVLYALLPAFMLFWMVKEYHSYHKAKYILASGIRYSAGVQANFDEHRKWSVQWMKGPGYPTGQDLEKMIQQQLDLNARNLEAAYASNSLSMNHYIDDLMANNFILVVHDRVPLTTRIVR